MNSNKSSFFEKLTLIELISVVAVLSVFIFNFDQTQQTQTDDSYIMAAMPSSATIQDLAGIHDEIAALPIAPEIRQQMLLYIEVAEAEIAAENMDSAREAVLDFCRRIEWYRYQIGHTKINNLFNRAMSIAVDLHNAAVG